MFLPVSYPTILFLLLLVFLSPRTFIILLAVIAIICTILENFVCFFDSPRLRFGTWCFSSSIISIAVYFSLCFINLIHGWISQFIQLSLYRLHFPHLVYIAVISFLVLQGPRFWATISSWNLQNKSELSSTSTEIDSDDRYEVPIYKVNNSHSPRLQSKCILKEEEGHATSLQVVDMAQVARVSPRLLYFLHLKVKTYSA